MPVTAAATNENPPEKTRGVCDFHANSLLRLLPHRDPEGNKGSFGHAWLLAGSRTYPGAALLSAEGCLRMGAGYTGLLSVPAVNAIAVARFPSLVLKEREEGFASLFPTIAALTKTALLIGPGLEPTPALRQLIYELLSEKGCPLILDAGALHTLACGDASEESIARLNAAERPVLLTPHPLEFSRLSGVPLVEIQENRLDVLVDFHKKCNVNIALKGHSTLVISKDGLVSRNTSGSSALAKAGSGDVLAGAVTAFAAMGMPLFDAARVAVYLHGLAGDQLEKRYSSFGVIPSDLPTAMAQALCRLMKHNNPPVMN